MAVTVTAIEDGSPAAKAGMTAGEKLISLNGNEIMDVLDYRFYQNECSLSVVTEREDGELVTREVSKDEYEELGLLFDTYLMDRQRSCRNKCIFCFIDQLPKGMRESLYFKDDDSRMSFLFGNYITLTNITDHEVERIISMHISPVNVSVHTTDPELRVRMMGNRFAGDALSVLWKLCDAGIEINTQLVLCPGYNDGEALIRSLSDLISRESIKSIALVPVGLTGHREGLTELRPFSREEAAAVIETAESFGEKCIEKWGERRVYPADEFYLIAGREMPPSDFYEDFAQLENGVGMWSLTADEANAENGSARRMSLLRRKVSSVTGEAAYPLISKLVAEVTEKHRGVECTVYPIRNDFFGGHITVTGLVTGGDIIKQLKGKDLGSELIVPSVMLRHEKDKFLDDVTVEELEQALGVKVRVTENDGKSLVDAVLGKNK